MYRKINQIYSSHKNIPHPSTTTTDIEHPWLGRTTDQIDKNNSIQENFTPRYVPNMSISHSNNDSVLNVQYKEQKLNHGTKDPRVWGPALWLFLHSSAANYPDQPNILCQKNAKNFILGLPCMLPCETCSAHAQAFIDARLNRMDDIVSSRKSLFAFFIDFHNAVNKRYNKPLMIMKDAYKLYTDKSPIVETVHYHQEITPQKK